MATLTSTQRAVMVVAGLCVGLVLAVEFIPIQVTIWDGALPLTVNVISPSDKPRSVSCEAFGHRDYAEAALATKALPEMWFTTADPYDGQPLTISVPVSGRTSLMGRELRRSQFRFLVVIAVMPDGRRVGTLVEIPDVRVSRSLNVTLPAP